MTLDRTSVSFCLCYKVKFRFAKNRNVRTEGTFCTAKYKQTIFCSLVLAIFFLKVGLCFFS